MCIIFLHVRMYLWLWAYITVQIVRYVITSKAVNISDKRASNYCFYYTQYDIEIKMCKEYNLFTLPFK